MNTRYVLVASILAGLMTPAAANSQATIPTYDSQAYCAKLAEAAGGSYEIEATCRDTEREAQDALQSRASIEPRVLTYCDGLAVAAGGTYELLLQCVKDEEEAAAAIKAMRPLDPRIDSYCQHLSQAAGDTYVLQLQCIKDELKAKGRVR